METIVLKKGDSIKFLDYTIKNSSNNDGLVLMKEGKKAKSYECHLGNYGTGTQKNIDICKQYAILYFIAARPEKFATQVVHKMRELNSGCMHEYYAFKKTCEEEKIEMPKEITCGDSMNAMIYFKDKPLGISRNIIEKNDYKKMLETISQVIKKFLKYNGGMDNGYITYVKGYITYNTHGGGLIFQTPKSDDLTGKELKKLSSDLEEKIIMVLKDYDYYDTIEIISKHMEHGCYSTEVKLSFSVSVIN